MGYRLPIFIGTGAGGASFQTNAISFDSSTEYMANTTDTTLSIANTFSVLLWIKPTDNQGFRWLFMLSPSGSIVNRIAINVLSNNEDFQMTLNDSAGTSFKDYRTSLTATAGAKNSVGLRWNGTTFDLFVNGVKDTTPTKSTDSAGTMTSNNRSVYFARRNSDTSSLYSGEISVGAVWDAYLSDAEFSSLHDSGNGYQKDLRNNFGSYASSANLQHYWPLGKDVSPSLGQDLGAGTAINVETNAANISDADIVTF